MSGTIIGGNTQIEGQLNIWTSAAITSAGLVSASDFRDYTFSGSRALISDASKNIAESIVTSAQIGYLSTTSADIQSQLNARDITLFSIAANYQRTSTGNLTSGTLPGNTFSQTIPTKIQFFGTHGYNFTSGSSTIALSIAGTVVYISTLIGSGSNKSNQIELDAYVRYAGGSNFEVQGLVKKLTLDGGTPSYSLEYVASSFTATVSSPINFSFDTTITGNATATLIMAKVIKG